MTSRSIPRLPIYESLGVPEVWRFDGKSIECLHLTDGGYRASARSLAFPLLRPADLMRFVRIAMKTNYQNQAVRALRAWVKTKRWGKSA